MSDLPPPPDLPGRILLVRPSALGDVARTVPLLVRLRQAYPHAQIDWLVNRAFADVIRAHPALSEPVLFDRVALARLGWSPASNRAGLDLLHKLRHPRYDLAIDAQGLFRSGALTMLTAARRRIGFVDAREWAWVGYNVRVPVDPSITHTVDRMVRLLPAAGVDPGPVTPDSLRLYTPEDDDAWAGRFVADRGLERFVCLAPTARWPSKSWPARLWAELAERLLRLDHDLQLVMLVAPSEVEQLEPVLAHLRKRVGETVVAGRVKRPQTTVGRMMGLIDRADLLVGNDSAAIHIAVGLHRPLVAIFGPTDPAYVGPYGRDDDVLRPHGAPAGNTHRAAPHNQSLIAQVSVDDVWRLAEARLAAVDQPLKRGA